MSHLTLPFQQVSMDLITAIPTSNSQNAILTIVNYGSRAVIFLPYNTTITRIGITCLYLDHTFQ